MAITRRQFIQRTGLATAGLMAGPAALRGFFGAPALADTIGPLDRYLVILFLSGGNDGVGTIIPVNDVAGYRSAYEASRNTGNGGLRIANPSVPGGPSLLDPATGTQLGFHPALVGNFQNLWEAGKVAIVQGCGYPEYNLSHEESETIWETANPLGVVSLATGAFGRHLEAEYGSTDLPAVSVSGRYSEEFRQTGTNVLAIRRLKNFGFPYDGYHQSDEAAKRTAFSSLYAEALGSSPALLQAVGQGGGATLAATDSFATLHDTYESTRSSWLDDYETIGGTARRFAEVAKIIHGVENGVVDARFAGITQGGYDTHSGQGGDDPDGRHYGLLQNMGEALELFYADLTDMGVAHKVTTLVWSEFSRRIPQNNNGTDHGSQGPMFVVGDSVNGGIYGNHPEITALDDRENTAYSQDPLDPARSTDFRDVYGTVLKHWVGVADPSPILPTDTVPVGEDPDEYWTSADFDLGFL